MSVERYVTVVEAARLSGRSKRAIEGRIGRKTLPSIKRRGRRYVALADLYATGLVQLEAGKTVTEMLDRIEELARKVGELEAELRRREGGRGAEAPRP
jgi:hypothetical protein